MIVDDFREKIREALEAEDQLTDRETLFIYDLACGDYDRPMSKGDIFWLNEIHNRINYED